MDLSKTALWVVVKVVAQAVAATVLTSASERAFKEEDLVVVVVKDSAATHKANREKAVMVAINLASEVLVEASAEALVKASAKVLVASDLLASVDQTQALEASVAHLSAAEKVVMALMAQKLDAAKVVTATVASVVQVSTQEKIALVDQHSMKVNSVQSAAQTSVAQVSSAHL